VFLEGAFVKTLNISHATRTGLESAGEKQLNPAVQKLIENLPGKGLRKNIFAAPYLQMQNLRMQRF
jgi:hypothetical protein